MKFVIDRSKWVCGYGALRRGRGPTELLNAEGFMCCLGQVSIQCGVDPQRLYGLEYPSQACALGEDISDAIEWLVEENGRDSHLTHSAVNANDHRLLNDEERESRLTSLFAEYDHEIEFTGTYVFPEETADV